MLESLNPSQRDAVTHREGPLVIVAGAGSGKTRVITHRIAHLIAHCEIAPESIAAMTFTNKAADEMRTRVASLLEAEGLAKAASEVTISTFHSLGARLLRRHGERLGLDRDFSILDSRGQTDLLRDVLERTDRQVDRSQRRSWQNYIEWAKHRAITPEEARAEASTDEELERVSVYADYQHAARKQNCVDFGDLLLGVLELFRDDVSLARRYSQRWSHLMVDEFQDTNPAQYEWLDHLTTAHTNLAVVGDDDQSIYRWRGADVSNILEFESDYPEAEVVTLDRNYRSSPIILEAAHDIIEHNPKRRDKELWTEREEGEPITCFVAETARGEAAFIADHIRTRIESGLDPGAIAVVYRTNQQGDRLEEQCRAEGVPYRVRGRRSLYEYREIRDLLAYLRLALNPEDDVSALRILGVPPRGIGDTTIDKLRAATEVGGLETLLEAARHVADVQASGERTRESPGPDPDSDSERKALERLKQIRGQPVRGVAEFVELMEDLQAALDSTRDLAEIVLQLIERLQYRNYLERRHEGDSRSRLERLRRLIETIRSFERERRSDGVPSEEETRASSTLRDFLERASLVDETSSDDETSTVTLTTVHGAKGLEFDTLFVAGLEEGLFPHVEEDASPAELHEERRLAYVAFTRAERKIYATWALERRRRGEWSRQQPSRFLLEIEDERLEFHDDSRVRDLDQWEETHAGWSDGWGRSSDETRDEQEGSAPLSEKRASSGELTDSGASAHSDEEIDDLANARVSHAKFGTGTVREVTEAGGRTKLTIEFDEGREQTIVQSFVEILES